MKFQISSLENFVFTLGGKNKIYTNNQQHFFLGLLKNPVKISH